MNQKRATPGGRGPARKLVLAGLLIATASAPVRGQTGAGVVQGTVRDPSMHDFQPRFGFAGQVLRSTVIRGGYGLYFLPTTEMALSRRIGFDQGMGIVATDASNRGGYDPIASVGNPFPNGLLRPLGASAGETAGIGTGITANLRTYRRGYSQQFNFTVGGRLYAGSRPNQSIAKWRDAAAFTLADGHMPGNAPRNLSSVQSDGLQNLGVSLLKSFSLTERTLTAEAKPWTVVAVRELR